MADTKNGKAAPATIEDTVPEIVKTLQDRSDSDLASLLVRELTGEERVTLIEPIIAEQQRRSTAALPEIVAKAVEKFLGAADIKVDASAVEDAVKAYLDEHLETLVAAAMPATPEQQAQRQRESEAEAVRKRTEAAQKKAKREAKAQAKAEAEAAERQAKAEAEAAEAFKGAVPFTGKVADITDKVIRGIAIDNGKRYSTEHAIEVRRGELEETTDGSLLLTKEIELPARGREFRVEGVSLITDAGRIRVALNGNRKCGGGAAVKFPAKSIVFRPHTAKPDTQAAE